MLFVELGLIFDFTNSAMSFDKRQAARTQGRYGADKPSSDNKKSELNHERKRNGDLSFSNNNSGHSSFSVAKDSNGHHFPQLEIPAQAEAISEPGFHILSDTKNGVSRIYFDPKFIPEDEGYSLFRNLLKNVTWSSKKININGQEHRQPRLVAWYGPLPYSYSGIILKPKEIPEVILKIKQKVEHTLRENNVRAEFNSVLLNLYRNNKDSVAWHSDDESSMGIHPTIGSVSLGEERRFELCRKQTARAGASFAAAEYVVYLNHGSLVVMDGVMQQDWLHRVPKEYHDRKERINLTFRTVFPIENAPYYFSSERSYNRNETTPETAPALTFQNSDPYEHDSKNFPSLEESASEKPKPQRDWSRHHNKFAESCNDTSNSFEDNAVISAVQEASHCNQVVKCDTATDIDPSGQNRSSNWCDSFEDMNPTAKISSEPHDGTIELQGRSTRSSFPSSLGSKDLIEESIQFHDETSIVDTERERLSGGQNSQIHDKKDFQVTCNSKLNADVEEFVPRQQAEICSRQLQCNNEGISEVSRARRMPSTSINSANYSKPPRLSRRNNNERKEYRSDSQFERFPPHNKRNRQNYDNNQKFSNRNFDPSSRDYDFAKGKLDKVYSYIKNSWESISFTGRDRKELNTLFLVVEECDLNLKVMKSITERMTSIVTYAEYYDDQNSRGYVAQQDNIYYEQQPPHYDAQKGRTFTNKKYTY